MGMTGLDSLRQDLEEVSIEAVHVGDYIYVPSDHRPHCVLSKATTRLAATDKVAGWRVELIAASPLWIARGAKVLRQRFGSAAPSHTVRARASRVA
jgi:hypothetical protein